MYMVLQSTVRQQCAVQEGFASLHPNWRFSRSNRTVRRTDAGGGPPWHVSFAPDYLERNTVTMRTLTYYIATSLDGFVSRTDGSLDDFGFDGEHVADLLAEFPETIPTHLRSDLPLTDECRHFDTVLMGRTTYEVGLSLGFGSPYEHLKQYVFV